MANESDEAMAFNDTIASDVPVYLKQSLPMIVVYTVAYSSVFFLGKSIQNAQALLFFSLNCDSEKLGIQPQTSICFCVLNCLK